nr:DUF6397 family protein [Streptomyces olivoverticillatus]
MAVQQGVASHATPNAPEHSVSLVRAARELQLKPRQFDLAVQLGEVGTLSGGPGGRLRVAREEIDRHRSSPGFPEALRSRLWVVGTAEGAELMGIGPARFVRLARGGCFAPVRFYVNRYRAVVWHYLAAEVVEFADHSPEMLKGRIPAVLKSALEENPDRRARGWRARRLDQLSARADGPWERAAVLAAVLDAAELARAVTDPAERAYISALSPALVTARPGTPAVQEVIGRLVLAQDPDEIEWHRECLVTALAQARAEQPVPGTDGNPAKRTGTAAPAEPACRVPARDKQDRTERRGLWARLRRRRAPDAFQEAP